MKYYLFIASFLFIFSCNKPSNQNTIVQNAQEIKLDSILTPYIKNIRELTNNKAGFQQLSYRITTVLQHVPQFCAQFHLLEDTTCGTK